MALEQLVPALTGTTDPLEGQIKDSEKTANATKSQLDNVNLQLQALGTMDKPQTPEMYTKSTAQVTFGITAAAVVLLFLFHCIIWVLKLIFPITWNTWGWTTTTFFWGIGISTALTIIAAIIDYQSKKKYEEDVIAYGIYTDNKNKLESEIASLQSTFKSQNRQIDQLYKLRFNTLGYALNKKAGMPYPTTAIRYGNYGDIKKEYLEFLKLLNSIKTTDDIAKKAELRTTLMNKKLQFLYTHSLKEEVSPEVYKEFKKQYDISRNTPMVLRQEIPAASSPGAKELMLLVNYEGLLHDDHLTPIVDRFNAVANRNTNKSGFLSFMTDSDKKAQQTRDLQELATAAKQEYDELMEINRHVSYALEFARGCAYRNIYLGAELINYLRDTAGGGALAKAQDTNEMISLNQDDLNIEAFSIDSNVSGAVGNTLGTMINAVMDNRQLQQLVKDNPKMAAGIAAVAALGSAAVSYASNLYNNAKAQSQLIDTVQQLSDGYTEGKSGMLRAIEIIGAIVEANKGFMAVYEHLSKRVFVDGVTNPQQLKMDIAQLGQATSKYKRIADSKIRK